jgi:hypothetical protein
MLPAYKIYDDFITLYNKYIGDNMLNALGLVINFGFYKDAFDFVVRVFLSGPHM